MNKPSLFLIAWLVIALLGTACSSAMDSELLDTTDSKFQVGQVWSYHTRVGEEQSHLTIVKVETIKRAGRQQVFVHVYVDGLVIRGLQGTVISSISHLPFAEEALEQSVIDLIETSTTLPDFQSGYDSWRNGFDSGKASVWSITVAEAIDFIIAEYGR